MNVDEGIIFNIKKYAIHDGPGIRTTVFLKGCPLSCGWCHNPEGISSDPLLVYRKDLCIGCGECVGTCPNDALALTPDGIETDSALCKRCGICAEVCPAEAREFVGNTEAASRILELIQKDVPFFDESGGGITFSGGEPLLQPEFLLRLLDGCGKRGIHRTVDTSGYADTDTLLAVAQKTDLFLFDVKLMDSEKHRRFTGVSNKGILSNLVVLTETGVPLSIRIPLIPGINDDEENIDQSAAFIKRLPNVRDVHLLPYHDSARSKYGKLGRKYRFSALEPPSESHMEFISKRFAQKGLQVKIGG